MYVLCQYDVCHTMGFFIFHLQSIDDDHHLTFVVTCMFFIYCHVLLFGTKNEHKNKCALLYLLVMFSNYNMRLSKILILRFCLIVWIERFSEHLYPTVIKSCLYNLLYDNVCPSEGLELWFVIRRHHFPGAFWSALHPYLVQRREHL